MKITIQSFLIAIGLLSSVGCVTVEQDKRPDSWPAILQNPNESQFTGVYRATPTATTSSAASSADIENSLPFFLAEMKNSKAASCRVEAISGALVLKTKIDSVEIATTRSRSSSKKGALFIRNETKRIIDPLANGVTKNNLYLFATTDGSLIGLREGYGTGLVLAVLPAVGTGKNWILWKRAEQGGGGNSAALRASP